MGVFCLEDLGVSVILGVYAVILMLHSSDDSDSLGT